MKNEEKQTEQCKEVQYEYMNMILPSTGLKTELSFLTVLTVQKVKIEGSAMQMENDSIYSKTDILLLFQCFIYIYN